MIILKYVFKNGILNYIEMISLYYVVGSVANFV